MDERFGIIRQTGFDNIDQRFDIMFGALFFLSHRFGRHFLSGGLNLLRDLLRADTEIG